MDTKLKKDINNLGVPIPELIMKLSNKEQKIVFKYIEQLDEIHKEAYKIAYSHLGDTFNIKKSNGFQEWIKENN